MIYSFRALAWASLFIAHGGALQLDPAVLPRNYLNTSSTAAVSLASAPSAPPILPSVKPGSETTHIPKPPPLPTYLPDPADGDGEPQPPPSPTIVPDPADEPGDWETSSGKPSGSGSGSPVKPPVSSFAPPPVTPPSTSRSKSSVDDHSKTSLTRSTPCSSRRRGEPSTVWIILPNPTTLTVTVGGNYSMSSYSSAPEFTPPVYCPEPILISTKAPPPVDATGSPTAEPAGSPDSPLVGIAPPTTTVITTSKNPVVIFTTAPIPQYPGGGKTDKQTVKPTADPRPLPVMPPGSPPSPGSPPPPHVPPPPGVTAAPLLDDGGSGAAGNSQGPVPPPVATSIEGVPVDLAPSFAVIEGTTYNFADPPQTITAAGVAVSVGRAGLGFSQTTVAPLAQPTNVVILDGEVFTAVGSSLVVFDGTTLTYGESSTFTTAFHEEFITLGDAISFDGTTLGGAANTGTQLGIAGGVSVTQIGQSVGVVSSTSLTVGPQAVPTTVIIKTYTITANSEGLGLAGITLSYPFNPSTRVVTAGGITFSEIGSTIVVVGGSTYTIGAGSKPTSTIFNGQTISFGPGGIGFSTTTLVSATSSSTSTPAEQTSKESGVGALKPIYGLLGACMVICIGCMI